MRDSGVRRRIVHLIPTLEGGGAERQLVQLANAQARWGHEVHIGVTRLGTHASAVDPAVSAHVAGAGGHYDPRLIVWAVRLLGRIRPDVVQTWLPMMDVVGGVAARAHGTPWVLSERSSRPAYVKRWQDRIVRRAVGRLANAVVANSSAGLEYWTGRRTQHQLHVVIRNALDLDRIAKIGALANWPGTEQGLPRILFAGRLDAAKNVFTLIRALQLLRPRLEFSALILGEGPDAPTARTMVAQAGLADVVTFGGYREDLWAFVKAASVVVSTSWFEGQPNTVLEALACGRPVIVSDIAQHREFLDESAVRFAPPGDALAFADALAATLADPTPALRTAAGYAVVEPLRTDVAVAAYDLVYQAVRRAR